MPMYVRRCSECAHTFEEFAKIDERDAIRCAQCGAATEGVPTAIKTQRRFAGSEAMSRVYEFIPSDVHRMRKITAGTGATIDDTGHVWFDDRSTETKFRNAINGMATPPEPSEDAASEAVESEP